MSANTSTLSDITFPNTNNTYNILNSIVIPASFIRHRSISTGKTFNLCIASFLLYNTYIQVLILFQL